MSLRASHWAAGYPHNSEAVQFTLLTRFSDTLILVLKTWPQDVKHQFTVSAGLNEVG